MNYNNFSQLLLKWNKDENKRQMPWKGEKDAYKIWISEIILQQTRVDQGMSYYARFIENFPTINDLALANDKEIFKLWEGLGYYSRCKNLIATARHIHQNSHGIFPSSFAEIINLKGIGPYTAAAIASFAFNLPHAVVDGNVFRILARVFGILDPIDNNLAHELLDKKKPAIYNQAIMDFGATVCKPAAPLCPTCILKNECVAYNEKMVDTLPVKNKKTTQRTRHFYFFEIHFKQKVAIRERTEKDIWQHLHELPLIELTQNDNLASALEIARANGWINETCSITFFEKNFTQKLTHQTIKARFIKVWAQKKPTGLQLFLWEDEHKLLKHSFPKIINDFFRTNASH